MRGRLALIVAAQAARGVLSRPADAFLTAVRQSKALAAPRYSTPRLSASSTMEVDQLTIQSISSIDGELTLPGSKSLSNRVLLLSALSRGSTIVDNLLKSEDVNYMLEALNQLNIKIDYTEANQWTVWGNGGPIDAQQKVELFLGNAGTAMRPLTAVLCAGTGEFVLDGTPRMRERPIVDLVDGLNQLSVNIQCSATGCPPVHIRAHGLSGGLVRLSGKISSQYLSALLMAAPLAKDDVVIEITDDLVSAPYVHMTIELMRKFGCEVSSQADRYFRVKAGQSYISPHKIYVEGDASSASYFLAGAAITAGKVTVVGCGSESVQGDVYFAKILEMMGADVKWTPHSITVSRPASKKLKGIDVDCGVIPDAAMTLAIVALFAEGPTAIRNVYNWRVKETERMHAIVTELSKLGAEVEEGRDFCIVHPPKMLRPNVAIDTYDDHRMAMCFSLAACGGVPVVIKDPKCVGKTFPDFFQVLKGMSR